ncbi:MAG TPA: DUF4956 domain-containing protein [Feifaniaceae bacterium]|nr:DUF4956 domain-containing protein [Feifaniaceae bacterium]
MPTTEAVEKAFDIRSMFTSSLPPMQILVTMLAAFAIGLFIFFIYRKTFGSVLYSRTFNLSLIMLTMVSSLVIMLLSINVAFSLGMVGALSIIRFRTAVKDPMDTTFMFWAVGEGIALGAQFLDVAVIGAVIIGVIMVLLTVFKVRGSMPYLLILHFHEAANAPVKNMLKQLPRVRVRSRTVQRDGVELTLEVRLRDEETAIVDKFLRVEGVYDATLIAHQGDFVS